MRHLIIAGTEKSGTTSVFLYLNSHPEVVGSIRKETDYFRQPKPHDRDTYTRLFSESSDSKVLLDASPGYLADSLTVSESIAETLPDAKLLFILRDPIKRLMSSFEFHKSRFHIPKDLSFDDYISLCLSYEKKSIKKDDAQMSDWHLRVPNAGRYSLHLHDFYSKFKKENIMVLTHDDLSIDPQKFMVRICKWIEIDTKYYDNYEFIKANVTFRPRIAFLQKIALLLNDTLEPIFINNPKLKQKLLKIYKALNARQKDRIVMSKYTEQTLIEYYKDDINDLIKLVGASVSASRNWLRDAYVK